MNVTSYTSYNQPNVALKQFLEVLQTVTTYYITAGGGLKTFKIKNNW